MRNFLHLILSILLNNDKGLRMVLGSRGVNMSDFIIFAHKKMIAEFNYNNHIHHILAEPNDWT